MPDTYVCFLEDFCLLRAYGTSPQVSENMLKKHYTFLYTAHLDSLGDDCSVILKKIQISRF